MASKSLSLSPSGNLSDVNSCLWLVNVATHILMRWSNSTWTAFLTVMSLPRCLISPFWRKDLAVHPLKRCRVFLFFDVVFVAMSSCMVVVCLSESLTRRTLGKVCVTVMFGKSDFVVVSVPLFM